MPAVRRSLQRAADVLLERRDQLLFVRQQPAAACQQVADATGFTLEFPLQRAYRRARAVQLWADALIAPVR
jgi:hypothetical protein